MFLNKDILFYFRKKNTVASTNGNGTIKENIMNIFGPKQVETCRYYYGFFALDYY